MKLRKLLNKILCMGIAVTMAISPLEASVKDIVVSLSNAYAFREFEDIGSVESIFNYTDFDKIAKNEDGMPLAVGKDQFISYVVSYVAKQQADAAGNHTTYPEFDTSSLDNQLFLSLLEEWEDTITVTTQLTIDNFTEYAKAHEYTPAKNHYEQGQPVGEKPKSTTTPTNQGQKEQPTKEYNQEALTASETANQGVEGLINQMLAKHATDKDVTTLSQEAEAMVNNMQLGGTSYANLKSWVILFYLDKNGTPATTWAILKNRAISSNGTTGANVQGVKLDEDGNVIDNSSTIATAGTAENGTLIENSEFTNKEKAYRSDSTNQIAFKQQITNVAKKYPQALDKYLDTFPEQTMDSANAKTRHYPVYIVGKDPAGNEVIAYDHSSSAGKREYDLLTKSLTVELEGLELLAMYHSVLEFGSLEDGDKAKYYEDYKKFIEDTSNKLYPVEIGQYGSDITSEELANKYLYYNSLAAIDSDSDIAKTFNSKGWTVGQVAWSRYTDYTMKHLYSESNTNTVCYNFKSMSDSVALDKTDISDPDAQKKETIESNNEGIGKITSHFSGIADCSEKYTEAMVTPKSLSTLTALAAYKTVEASVSNSLDADSTKNSLIITDRYNADDDSDCLNIDNKFMQMELVIYGALNPEAILEQYGLDSTKLSTESEDVEAFKTYMELNVEYMRELAKVGTALSNFYKMMGYPGRAETLNTAINEMLERINSDILSPLNLSVIESYSLGDNITPDESTTATKDKEDEEAANEDAFANLKDSEAYYELLAWTACFTPFETNISDVTDNMTYLSDEAKTLFATNNLGYKRSPVYAVQGNTRNITAVKKGNLKKVDTITLRDFIDRVKSDDMVLFAGALTQQQIQVYLKDSVVISQSTTSKSSEDGNTSESSTAYSVSTLPNQSDTTANVTKYLGPIYMSSCDQNYATVKGVEAYERAESQASEQLNLLIESDVKNEENQQPTAEASVGNMGLNAANVLKSNATDTLYTNASQAALLSKHITASHLYLNYCLMWNTLQDGHQYDSALVQDMDRPLYVDFLGNVVTENGYVVIPMAANTTYYQKIKGQYPFYTAMMLNAYPRMNISVDSNVELSAADTQKYFLSIVKDNTSVVEQVDTSGLDTEHDLIVGNDAGSSNKRYKYKMMRFGDKGTKGKLEDSLYVTPPMTDFALGVSQETDSIFKTPLTDQDGKSLEGNTLSFIDPITSYQELGKIYARLGGVSNTMAKALSIDSYQYINFNTNDGIQRVPLNGISPLGTDAGWGACIGVIKNHYLSTEVVANQDTNTVLCVDDILIPLSRILYNCSDDPAAMLIEDNFKEYENVLKGSNLLSAIGEFFEMIVNKWYRLFDDNILLYTPSLDNLSSDSKYALYATPIALGLLIIAIAISLIAISLRQFTENKSIGISTIVSVFLSAIFVIYAIYGHPTVNNFVFNELPSKILGNDALEYQVYDTETDYKIRKDNFFASSDTKASSKTDATIMIDKLSKSEMMKIRKSQTDRPEIDSAFYDPRYDNSRYNAIGTNIYIKRNGLYVSVNDILNGSSLKDYRNKSGTYSIGQDIYDAADILTTYVPYYHILEAITTTVNTYTEDTNISVRVKNYSNQSMLTGRAQAFYSSIFYIAPSKLDLLKARLLENYTSNTKDKIAEINLDSSLSEDERLIQIENAKNALQEKSDGIDEAFKFILEGIGDTDDWLGLRFILKTDEYRVFSDEAIAKMKVANWYPNLDGYTEAELNTKIVIINREVKNYVLDELLPVAHSYSDSTILKMVALKATLAFDSAFSEPFGKQLYPKVIESKGLDSAFNVTSTYIPKSILYSSASIGTGYLLASTEGWPVLLLGCIETVLRWVFCLVIISAIFLLNFLIFALFLSILLGKKDISRLLAVAIAADLIVCSCRYVMVFFMRLGNAYIQNGSVIGVQVGFIVLYGVLAVVLRYLIPAIYDRILRNTEYGDQILDRLDSLQNIFFRTQGKGFMQTGMRDSYQSMGNFPNYPTDIYSGFDPMGYTGYDDYGDSYINPYLYDYDNFNIDEDDVVETDRQIINPDSLARQGDEVPPGNNGGDVWVDFTGAETQTSTESNTTAENSTN